MPIAERGIDVAALPLELKAEKIVELRRKGLTYAQIAKELRVSTRDIARVLKGELRKDEIANLRERVEGVEKLARSLAERMDNASFALRHAIGHAGMEIRCPLCREFSRITFDRGARRWVCSNCGEIPF